MRDRPAVLSLHPFKVVHSIETCFLRRWTFLRLGTLAQFRRSLIRRCCRVLRRRLFSFLGRLLRSSWRFCLRRRRFPLLVLRRFVRKRALLSKATSSGRKPCRSVVFSPSPLDSTRLFLPMAILVSEIKEHCSGEAAPSPRFYWVISRSLPHAASLKAETHYQTPIMIRSVTAASTKTVIEL